MRLVDQQGMQWPACQSADFNRSIRRSQLITGFQLALFWSTILRSRELTPKRELRLGEPCEGCLAEAAERRRRTT